MMVPLILIILIAQVTFQTIKKFVSKGFLEINNYEVKVTELGRFFVRHICQIFDIFLKNNEKYEIHGP